MAARTNSSNTSRAPRRDALRNDAIVLNAARAVFAEQGPQASMESVAARAGLGVGTIYRRFSGKKELLEAIAKLFAEELDEAAAAAVADPDTEAALERFLDFAGAFNAEKLRYAAAVTERVISDETITRTTSRVHQLAKKAVDAGVLAPGVTGEDLTEFLVAIRAVIAAAPDGEHAPWRRFVRIHLAGLRASAAG